MDLSRIRMRFFALLFIFLASVCAQATQFNVYVKYDDTELKQSLQQFYTYLGDQGLLEKYQIRPFLLDYPLHTTLYLADYESYSVPYMMDLLKATTDHWAQFTVKTDAMVVTEGNYVMLNTAYKPRASGMNPRIQTYSDEIVLKLMNLRDKQAPIPDWAKNDPVKLRAFQRYGSPNVFFEFTPHFTLMAKQFKNKETAKQFQLDMKQAISDYQTSHPSLPLKLMAKEIGLAYVNEFGQITREIGHYPLKK